MKKFAVILAVLLPLNALAGAELNTSTRPSDQLMVLELGQLGLWGTAVRRGDSQMDIGLFSDELTEKMSVSPAAVEKGRAFVRHRAIGLGLLAGGTGLLVGDLVAMGVMSQQRTHENAGVHVGILAGSVAFNVAAAVFSNLSMKDLSAAVGIYNAEYVDGLTRGATVSSSQ